MRFYEVSEHEAIALELIAIVRVHRSRGDRGMHSSSMWSVIFADCQDNSLAIVDCANEEEAQKEKKRFIDFAKEVP